MTTPGTRCTLSIEWQDQTPRLILSREAMSLLRLAPGKSTLTLLIKSSEIPTLTPASPVLASLFRVLGEMSEDERAQFVAMSERMADAFHPPSAEKAELVDPQTGARKCVTVTHQLQVRSRPSNKTTPNSDD